MILVSDVHFALPTSLKPKEVHMDTAVTTSNQSLVPPHKKVVPLKHRPNCPTAEDLFDQIKASENFDQIKADMLRSGVCKTEKRADDLVNAFLQWFCAGATTVTKSFVMFTGPIDNTFHVMILNTKWYFWFCHKHTGVYTHHDPLNAIEQKTIADAGAIKLTIDLLCDAWGANLHPELKKLVRKFERGQLVPSSVSCVGNDGPFDILLT